MGGSKGLKGTPGSSGKCRAGAGRQVSVSWIKPYIYTKMEDGGRERENRTERRSIMNCVQVSRSGGRGDSVCRCHHLSAPSVANLTTRVPLSSINSKIKRGLDNILLGQLNCLLSVSHFFRAHLTSKQLLFSIGFKTNVNDKQKAQIIF